ncbi:hypothetical protein KDH_75900 [Dictyobacter sp. S3.2.2.5]|uniref:Uncharacterized protein n=1 Tax=Dictyobacter halimunensis TaxID=3026934 RepID=A0ABQ6G7I7_9CHLR|nr:hypothetical protein KDH_75900 [Dictyobacter sp. S3.2.2.5]
MLLTDLENMVRLDLFDPAGPNQRWSQGDIDRALDRAVERYSAYYPNIAYVDMPTQARQRSYPYPTSWNPAYPVLWIERILYPLVDSAGSMCWPPIERAFSEFSAMFDAAGAIGGQQPGFTLHLGSAELPQDGSQLMRVFYATKHQLDSSGSTIPELHRDLIVAGACAYAMQAYQVPSNDNFDFQDGALHDRLDDTKIPGAWLAAAGQRLEQFEARLQEIKRQRDYASAARLHWGDVPRYWSRL